MSYRLWEAVPFCIGVFSWSDVKKVHTVDSLMQLFKNFPTATTFM